MDLTEARRLEAAATQAPWIRPWNALFIHVWGRNDVLTKQENVDLAVHLRNHATDYFDAVEQRDQLRKALERLLKHHDAQYGDEWCSEADPAREALRRQQGEAAR